MFTIGEERYTSAGNVFKLLGIDGNRLRVQRVRVIGREDRTASVLSNASGRLRARNAQRQACEELEGVEGFARQQRYLETVVALSERKALSRVMYLAELAAV